MSIVVEGTAESRALLRSLSGRELQNRVRRGTRRGAAVFRDEVRRQARGRADIPDQFARTLTRGHRTPVGTSTGPSSPLINIFEPGAGPHTIAPRRAGVLSNYYGSDVAGEPFFARGPVRHPGMAARPLIDPIFEKRAADASDATFEGIMEGLR